MIGRVLLLLRLVLCTVFVLPVSAMAAVGTGAVDTWYSRPLAACANNGDGLSYACAASNGAAGAFKGLVNIIATATVGVDDGDKLYICGTHTAEQLEIYQDATSAAPIDIDLGCPSDPGTLAPTAQNYALYVEGSYITVHGGTINGTGAALYPVLNATNGGVNTDVSGFTFYSMTLTNGINASAECLGFYGSEVTIRDNIIRHCAADAIHGHGGLNAQILRNTISFVSEGALDDGDCMHLTFIAGGSLVKGNTCDHTNVDRKYCFIVTSATTPGLTTMQDNTCLRLPTNTVGSGIYAESALLAVSNKITGGRYGIQCAEQIALTQCELVGNRLITQHDNGIILGSLSTNSPVRNNTIINPGLEAIFTANNGAGVVLENNLISTSYSQCIDKQAANIERYNLLYGCSTPVANSDVGTAIGTGTLTADPKLTGTYGLKSASPARRAGITDGWCLDVDGRPCLSPPDMGADQVNSGDEASARATRQ